MKAAAERLPKGSWITRGDWGAYEQWGAGSAGAAGGTPAQRGRAFMPDRSYVDPVTPDHPVFVSRFDRSAYFANSLALAARPASRRRPLAPPGGEIAKDASGRLTGVLKGAAADLVREGHPAHPLRAAADAGARGAARGARGRRHHDAGPDHGPAAHGLPGAAPARRADRAHHAPAAALGGRPTWRRSASRAGFGDEWLQLIGSRPGSTGSWAAAARCSSSPTTTIPGNKGYPAAHHVPRGRRRRGHDA